MALPDTCALRARLDSALDADVVPAVPVVGVDVRERLVRYVELLAKWNRVWNLTAVRDPIEMIERHVVDCLALLRFVDDELDASADERSGGADGGHHDMIDIGSGAGLPGLVLAAARPGLRLLSVERTAKKARFQRQVVLELGLSRVEVRDARIESVRERAGIVTSRAFAAPAHFLDTASALVLPGGRALVMLGRAERLPEPLPAPWTLERLVRTGEAPERHVAACRHRSAPMHPV